MTKKTVKADRSMHCVCSLMSATVVVGLAEMVQSVTAKVTIVVVLFTVVGRTRSRSSDCRGITGGSGSRVPPRTASGVSAVVGIAIFVIYVRGLFISPLL